MPHKHFISFLGAIPYHQTHYYWRPDRSDMGEAVPYVQEAIIRKCLPEDWTAEDRIYIFTTAEAFENNYKNKILRFDRANNQPALEAERGLEWTLSKLKWEQKIGHFEAVNIPNGYTEQEILVVFQRVFEQLEPGAEVYFDITFGFRSLPMLGMVLLNYARHVIGAKVAAIYYGNYEAGRAAKQQQLEAAKNRHLAPAELRKLENAPVQAPILNLLSLSILQEWTAGAGEFLHLGRTKTLVDLIEADQPLLAQQLQQFEQAITTCRGILLTQELDINALKTVVTDTKNGIIKEQLKPLVNKIEEKIRTFETGNILSNGFAAVEWCIQHNMIQQGITFLQETIVSFIIEQFIGTGLLTNHFFRDFTKKAIQQFTVEKNHIFNRQKYTGRSVDAQALIMAAYLRIRDFAAEKAPLTEVFSTLSKIRNDVNHCGFQEDYHHPVQIKGILETAYQKIKAINLQATYVTQPLESSLLELDAISASGGTKSVR